MLLVLLLVGLMANWAELIPDLLTLIAKKVELYEDFVAFRGVCRSWRSAAAKNNFCPVQQQQVPWLLLAGDDDDSRDFYSLTKGGMVHSVYLPEAKGKRIISSLGWLITIDIDGEMELLHPLSRSWITLPDASEFSDFDIALRDPTDMLERAVLSASPSDDEAYTLMALICYEWAYWRPGNNAWITIETSEDIEEVVYSSGQFYGMDCRGLLYSIDINNKTAKKVGNIPLQIMEDHRGCCYLVDSGDGHMIAVLREMLFDLHAPLYTNTWRINTYRTNSFRLFKFDSSYNCRPINDLGEGRSLFIGQCAPVLVSVGRDSIFIRPNCIYFTDGTYDPYFEGGGRDMGVYSLQQQEFIKDGAPIYQGNKGRSPLCPLLWVVPSF